MGKLKELKQKLKGHRYWIADKRWTEFAQRILVGFFDAVYLGLDIALDAVQGDFPGLGSTALEILSGTFLGESKPEHEYLEEAKGKTYGSFRRKFIDDIAVQPSVWREWRNQGKYYLIFKKAKKILLFAAFIVSIAAPPLAPLLWLFHIRCLQLTFFGLCVD